MRIKATFHLKQYAIRLDLLIILVEVKIITYDGLNVADEGEDQTDTKDHLTGFQRERGGEIGDTYTNKTIYDKPYDLIFNFHQLFRVVTLLSIPMSTPVEKFFFACQLSIGYNLK